MKENAFLAYAFGGVAGAVLDTPFTSWSQPREIRRSARAQLLTIDIQARHAESRPRKRSLALTLAALDFADPLILVPGRLYLLWLGKVHE